MIRPSLRVVVALLCAVTGTMIAVGVLEIFYKTSVEALTDIADQQALRLLSVVELVVGEQLKPLEVTCLTTQELVHNGPDWPAREDMASDLTWAFKFRGVLEQMFFMRNFTTKFQGAMGVLFDDASFVKIDWSPSLPDQMTAAVYDSRPPQLFTSYQFSILTAQPLSSYVSAGTLRNRTLNYDLILAKVPRQESISGWTGVFTLYLTPMNGFGAAAWLYNSSHSFIGLVYAHIDVASLAALLHTSLATAGSKIFMIDNWGSVVATSEDLSNANYSLYTSIVPSNTSVPASPHCSRNFTEPVHDVCRMLVTEYPDDALRSASGIVGRVSDSLLHLKVHGSNYIVASRQLQSNLTIKFNLSIVVIFPESDFTHSISDANRVAVLCAWPCVAFMTAVAVVLSYFVLRPLSHLTASLSRLPRVLVAEDYDGTNGTSALVEIQMLQAAYGSICQELILLRPFVRTVAEEPAQLYTITAPSDFGSKSVGERDCGMRMRHVCVLLVHLFDVPVEDVAYLSRMSHTVLSQVVLVVTSFSGVVDVLSPVVVQATFNAHTMCADVDHTAFQCAQRVREVFTRIPQQLDYAIVLDCGTCSVGQFEVCQQSVNVVLGDAVNSTKMLARLLHERLHRNILVTEHLSLDPARNGLVPVDVISMKDTLGNRTRLTVFEPADGTTGEDAATYAGIFASFAKGKYAQALSALQQFQPQDSVVVYHARRIENICRFMAQQDGTPIYCRELQNGWENEVGDAADCDAAAGF